MNESFEHKIDYLTNGDIDFLENNKASEKVEKKGRTPFEEILNSVKNHKMKI